MQVPSLVSGLAPVTSFMQSAHDMQSWAGGPTEGAHRPACLLGARASPLLCSCSVGQETTTLSVALAWGLSSGGGMFFLAPNAELMKMS